MRLDDTTVGTVDIGDLRVRRLGYGAMRVSGARNADGVRDRGEASRIYRRVYERGVNFIDIANIYGYSEWEEILAEALYPYPATCSSGPRPASSPGRSSRGRRRCRRSGIPATSRRSATRAYAVCVSITSTCTRCTCPTPTFLTRTP